ncbi:UvrD-helicase domain-containing protein [Candidatus Woesearchaeota archaeon]|nr:UvrD-helicase domain-containing protein [Candidatus Woesearchaeota archaeon]
MEFNSDGSLKVSKKHKDHLSVLRLVDEMDFPVGKKLLASALRGEVNEKIKRCKLDKKIYHGSLGGYDEEDLIRFIEYLLTQGLLQIEKSKQFSVVALSQKGIDELENPSLSIKLDDTLAGSPVLNSVKDDFFNGSYVPAIISEHDKLLFEEFSFFLDSFTDQQKKAIICNDERQVCIAGAGSGKTRVLTHKIVFLHKFLGVPANELLAITFTRKAKTEMVERLAILLPGTKIWVETFNSFAEKELLKHGNAFYGASKSMISNKDFVNLVFKGIAHLGFNTETFVSHYFTSREKRGKEPRQLFFSFLYDFRTILDTYILEGKNTDFFEEKIASESLSDAITAKNVIKLVKFVGDFLEENNLRTYADQLIDINSLYENFSGLRAQFSWVLVDEYQDVNEQQVKLLEYISSKNLFVVGDPRQSIYAWRGANPKMIFSAIEEGATVIELTANFRSTQSVVNFSNAIIAQTNRGHHSFAPQSAKNKLTGVVAVYQAPSEADEVNVVLDAIDSLACNKNEIFILSRTNKGLEKFSQALIDKNIKFLIRTDEKRDLSRTPSVDELTLSTVHAIKGLEAEFVFVVGASTNNYPCKTKDHRFVELLTTRPDYDQYEEERRLLYVACTRAKKELYISYTGAPSPFLSRKVLNFVTEGRGAFSEAFLKRQPLSTPDRIESQRSALGRWRFLESKERGIAPYMIFSDKVLDQLLSLQPLTVDELESIVGFGKTKIAEFGMDILHILHTS